MIFIKKGAIYIRVSTDDQIEYSPDAQLRAIFDYAKKNNIAILKNHIYKDEGKSGREAKKRPGFMKMINDAKKKPKPFDFILVHKFDRFARSRADSVIFKSLLQKECDIKVISVTENIGDDKMSLIMESILEAMAEYYSLNLSEEVKKGMLEKAYTGKVQNKAPFGYKMDNGRLIKDEKEAKVVKMIFDKFLEGSSIKEIKDLLREMKISTKKGNPFETRQIIYILKNPVYSGKIRWNPKGKTGRDFDNPNLIIVDGQHEKIIDNSTFLKTQLKLSKNKSKSIQNQNLKKNLSHYLVGKIRCGSCYGAMANYGSSFGCINYYRDKCKSKNSIGIKTLEKLLISKLSQDFGDDFIKIKYFLNEKEFYKKYSLIKEEIEILQMRLKNATLAYQMGVDTLLDYKIIKEKFENKINILKENLNKIAKKEQFVFKKSYLPSITKILCKNSDNLYKSKILSSIIKNIEYKKDENILKIIYYFD